jgi:hypothetical protein
MPALDMQMPFTAQNRCDRCGAQAMVRCTLKSGELYFCGHHARQFGTPLVLASLEVYDPEGVFNIGRS